MKKSSLVLAAVGALAFTTHAQAVTIFSDNFDDENGGNGALNYNSFVKWDVAPGTVDLIGNGYYDYLAITGQGNHGLYVDMDGSTGAAGTMTTKSSLLTLAPGNYILSYGLAGNSTYVSYPGSYPGPDTVNVSVQVGLAGTSYTLVATDPYAIHTLAFTLTSTTSASIMFQGIGGDNVGLLLDDVKLDKVPDGGNTAVLLGLATLGLGMVGMARAQWLRRCQGC
ncbi:MAG: hypothetical protein QOE70_6127 [Chthoniobacter sp.]|jgi:hypothetical protein|nr:hypothetical protein [Chthoniobacter sp.]